MVVGENVRIWVPAAFAYGEHPLQKSTPAGNLVYDEWGDSDASAG